MGYKYKEKGDIKLLGAAIGSEDWCEEKLGERVEKARNVMRRAAAMDGTQCGLKILRACLSYCKVAYNMRTVPPQAQGDGFSLYGQLLKEAVSKMVQADISDRGWSQAQLSIRNGGLGLRDPYIHAAGAYMASFRAAKDIAQDSSPGPDPEDKNNHSQTAEAIATHRTLAPRDAATEPRPDTHPQKQRAKWWTQRPWRG